MKNTLVRIAIMLLVAVMVMSCAACSGSGSGGYDVVINSENVAGDTEAQLKLQEELKDTCKDVTITVLSDKSEKSHLNQCYSQMFESMCGGEIEWIKATDYSSMQQKLASMHMSGEAPDVYEMTNQDFPSLMYKGILMPLNDKIDFESDVYTDQDRTFLNQLSWDGENYFFPTMFENFVNRGIWWNRTLFEQAGIPDSEMPDALYEANNWTWDTFYDLEKRVTNADEQIFGFTTQHNLLYELSISTGEDFVKVGEDGLESNFQSANVTRAMNFYKKVMDPLYYTSGANDPFKRGKVAMLHQLTSLCSDKKFAEMLEEGVLGIVPIPRDPQQDHHIMMGSICGYGVPISAKNADAGVAFIRMIRASDYYLDQVSEISYEKYNMNDEIKQYEYDYEHTFEVIPIISLGIKEIQSLCWSAIGTQNLLDPAKTWESVAAEFSPKVQSELDKLG